MGYMLAMGACIGCGRVFSFNPEKVPSSSAVTGKREPICSSCFDEINRRRKANGLEPFTRHDDAYEPQPEGREY